MGNSQSQAHSANAANHLLSKWSPQEQEAMKKVYEQLKSNDTPKDSQRSLPQFFSRELATSLETYCSSVIKEGSMPAYLKTADALISGASQDHATSAYRVFTKTVQRTQWSLEQFVQQVAASAVPLWFQTSGLSCDGKLLDERDERALHQLTEYLLYRDHKDRMRDQKAKQDDLFWLEDHAQQQQQQHTRKASVDPWLDQTTKAPSEITEAQFRQWFTRTSAFSLLFQLVCRYILCDAKHHDPRQLHQNRVAHLASPAVAQPNDAVFDGRFSRLLSSYDYFMLTQYLPRNALSWTEAERTERSTKDDVKHELVFSSRVHGLSWQALVEQLMGRGATLIIVKTKDGFVLGGYGDEPWKPVTDWYGNPRNFLFRLGHRDTGSSSVPYNDDGYLSTGAWQGTNHNTHFQYLCWGKKSLPNGLGMGGQFEYPGFWLDADLHLGRSCAGPTCTTYNSPQLSHDQMFEIDEIEVWLVNPVRIDPDDPTAFGQGFSRAENMEFLEMAGKKMYSKDLQKPPNATQDDQDD